MTAPVPSVDAVLAGLALSAAGRRRVKAAAAVFARDAMADFLSAVQAFRRVAGGGAGGAGLDLVTLEHLEAVALGRRSLWAGRGRKRKRD